MPAPEVFEEIRRLAHALAGEMEWIEFVAAKGAVSEAFGPEICRSGDFIADVRTTLHGFFNSIGPDEWRGHQEPLQEAAGVVQSAVKRTLARVFPQHAAILRIVSLRVKFAGVPVVFMQAPPDAWVPSMAEQLRGRKLRRS